MSEFDWASMPDLGFIPDDTIIAECAFRAGAAAALGVVGMAHAIAEQERDKAIEARVMWGIVKEAAIHGTAVVPRWWIPESTEDE